MSFLSKILDLLTPAERRHALALLGLMVIGMMLEMLGIGFLVPAIAIMMQGDITARFPSILPVFQFFGNPTQAQLIVGAMLGLVGIYFVKNLTLALLAWWQTRFAFGVQVQLSQRLFSVYLHQPYTFHLQRNSAQLIRNVAGEVSVFTCNTLIPAMLLLTEGMVLFGVGGLLVMVEPLGALVVVLVLGGAGWGFYHITRARVARWGVARQHHEGLRLQHLQQGLGGVKDVKLLGREDDFLDQYRVHDIQSARVGQFQATLMQLPRLWLELLAVTGLALLVLSMVGQGRSMVSIVPTLGLFAAAAFRLMPSANRVLGAVQSLRYGLPVTNTLHEELKLATFESSENQRKNANPYPPAFQTEICLSDISYAYPNSAVVALNDISILVQKGEFVGFIGSSGSGKSTLVDIILGLLTPINGQVTVDGQDIQRNMRAWQDQIGYVPQTIYLTDDTLRRNVAFGLPNEQIDDAAVLRAVHAAQLDEFVGGLPDGLETVVGERGVRLSGGQRQRIGIARALYHDPTVLVLDEATSALDNATERDVMQAVTALQGAKTILIVAHRLSTVENCGRIYRLEQGKVVEEGRPQKILLAQ